MLESTRRPWVTTPPPPFFSSSSFSFFLSSLMLYQLVTMRDLAEPHNRRKEGGCEIRNPSSFFSFPLSLFSCNPFLLFEVEREREGPLFSFYSPPSVFGRSFAKKSERLLQAYVGERKSEQKKKKINKNKKGETKIVKKSFWPKSPLCCQQRKCGLLQLFIPNFSPFFRPDAMCSTISSNQL